MKKKTIIVVIVTILALISLGFIFQDQLTTWFLKPTNSSIEQGVDTTNAKENIEIIKENLDTPWSISFLPNQDLLVTERSGRLQRIGETGQIFEISGVRETSEGGLLGVALHPDFEDNKQVYLYLTTESNGQLSNKVDLYTLREDSVAFDKTIIDNIPAASNHNGGGIAFGPDKKLYITTGDANIPDLSQDTNSLAGKILRLNDNGSTPEDNPYNNLVWSYGHRNPQGIAWDDKDQLWSVEHGPSGFNGSGQDELNLIEKGANYGWPVITGDQSREAMKSPVIQSGKEETWAPAGMAYIDGSLYFAGLRGRSLYQAKINEDNTVSLKRHFSDEYGRLRAVSTKENRIYFSTSNRDGRGSPADTDDRIISVSSSIFN